MRSIYKKIYAKIKKYDTIVIARHVGPDPDALGSSIGLRDIISNTFKNKKVYAVGFPASRFKYLGTVDKMEESYYDNALLIVCDTPDMKRIDGVDITRFKEIIKIDHHPFIEKYADIEWIDDTASSASQMVIELAFKTKLVMTKEAAEKLFIGVVADTNRFLFYYTKPKTFDLVSKLIKQNNLDFTSLYDNLYLRNIKEIRFQSYIADNLTITENGFAYIKIDQDALKKYEMDAATAGNMVGEFNYIEDVYAWAFFSEDVRNETIRGSIRSRGPIINDVASEFGGGGHIYASGVRLSSFDDVPALVDALDQRCYAYKNHE
ncbi:MAG: bifunctional oligoribonuclease/PAP phosphatase NrnA [Bacilli bacterium]|nr:bifunctional oligoribonuclease/PAP phosphatase NrnA [Bacilli bacterium]